jgi:hypothetical protein
MVTLVLVRRVGAGVLAAAAIAVWFLMAPDTVEIQDRSYGIERALIEYESNDAIADSAPQQQVTNGWLTKDLLTIIAEQQNAVALAEDRGGDDRVPALVGLLVLGVALALATTPPPVEWVEAA